MRLANAQFYSNAALNLAEAGIEEALYAINHKAWSEQNWKSGNGSNIKAKSFDEVDLGSGATGGYVVRVEDYDSFTPTVIVEGEVRFSGRKISKQLRAKMRRRALFANGLTSRDTIKLSGNRVYIASYRSSLGEGIEFDNGSVASVQVIEAVDLGNATIVGWVATGGAMPDWGPNARLYGFDSDSTNGVDEERISLDFSSSFPDVEIPDTGLPPISYGGQDSIGQPNVHEYYSADSINLSGRNSLTINGDVTLIVDNNFSISGQAEVIVESGASLTLYVAGDMDISGRGMANKSGFPERLKIFGSSAGEQAFSISGNGNLYSAIYAPNADVSINGGGAFGQVRGAIVGKDITMNGNTEFYYDEDLEALFSDDRYAMSSWQELYGGERYDFSGVR